LDQFSDSTANVYKIFKIYSIREQDLFTDGRIVVFVCGATILSEAIPFGMHQS
jgi:hypothetical protein